MARPRKKIDPEQVEKLAALNCSYEEMANVVGCDPSTLTRRFAQAIKKGRSFGNVSLRRKQFELAMAGNATMLIWLGKQQLGQRDRSEFLDDKEADSKDLAKQSTENLLKLIQKPKEQAG